MAQAFILGENFIGNDSVCIVLADSIFHAYEFTELLHQAKQNVEMDGNLTVFGYYVNDTERYGVAGFDQDGCVTSIIEKPEKPLSNYAVIGLYFLYQ